MRHADKPTAEERIDVDAPPERIWPIISDPGFLCASSPELLAVEWVGDVHTPQVGRQFVGTNANKYFGQWQTTSTVIECDEPTAFGWAVGAVEKPNTSWRFVLEPAGEGTRVTQSMQLGTGESGLAWSIAKMPDKEERIVERRMDDFRAAMRANLEAIKRHVEQP